MTAKILTERYGAYLVDDVHIQYYLVKQTSQPWKFVWGMIETTCSVAYAGEYICKGLWFNNVDRAPLWYILSEDEVTMRCQSILCSDIELVPHSGDNDLPPLSNWRYCELVPETMQPMTLHEDTYNQLMDLVSLWERLDYEEECGNSDSCESGGKSEESDLDETDEDIGASSGSNDPREGN